MHTPDGLLTGWICVLMWIVSISVFLFSVYKLKRTMNNENSFLLASLCALVFGFQMLNFPIASGTSGHFIGAGLIAVMLGPYAAVVGLGVVLALQAIFFGDGGVFALGANVFNMGIIAGFTSYYTYRFLKNNNKAIAAALASFFGVIAASAVASLQLGISGTYPFYETLIAMVSSHLFVGLGESAIVILSLFLLDRSSFPFAFKQRNYWLCPFILGAAFTLLFLPFASSSPDAMEKVAINFGFYEKALVLYDGAPFDGYALLDLESLPASAFIAIVGMMMSFAAGITLLRPRGLVIK